MSMTTIKVSTDVRDQLNELARRSGGTVNSVVEDLLRRWLREQRMQSVREAMARTSDEDWTSYWEETAAWDVTAGDGLENL